MEVDGKEFLRNIALEQDKERLAQEQRKLEALKRESVMRNRNFQAEEPVYTGASNATRNPYEQQQKQEESVEDIILEQEDPAKNKKRYILLGIGLILVFVITILVIRLVSNNDTQEKMENLNPETKGLAADGILDKIQSNEEHQRIIDNKALEASNKSSQADLNEIVIPEDTIAKTPLVIDKPKPSQAPQRDLFGLTKEEAALNQEKVEVTPPQPKRVVQTQPTVQPPQVIKQPVAKQPVAPSTVKTTKVEGFYIQIGAFTKEPSVALINTIKAKGYNYNIHKMDIKGTTYNKVLIGAYPTRAVATQNLEKVKADFNNKNAYILSF